MAESLMINEDVNGSIFYSEDVVATLAAAAATEVDGVSALSGGFDGKNAEKTKKFISKGVRVQFGEPETKVDVFLVVKFGKKLDTLGKEVQENVKHTLDTYAGIANAEVSVTISGIVMKEEKKEQK